MTTTTVPSTVLSDDQLWQRSRSGDRAAFRQIVERYQLLICSLAYSACGNLSRSEDLAQETFVAAWQQLGELREPTRLRAWLCGIARNRAANAARQERRRGGPPEPLDFVAELVSPEADPAVQAVTQEEATLLWRSLAELPETYREPLVLFYRQGQSITEVAEALELSPDAVKQRLSRGRAMLRDELTSVVESTLTRTRPTGAFTAAVLAAVAAVVPRSAEAAILAGAASSQGAGVTKVVVASIGKWAFFGPAIGLLIAWFSTRAATSTARSPQERACLLRYARRTVVFCWLMSIGLMMVLLPAGKLYSVSPIWIVLGVLTWVAVLVGTILRSSARIDREILRIRAATGTDDHAYGERLAANGLKLGGPLLYQSKLRLLGLPLLAFACGETGPDSRPTRRVAGWIACGDVAVSPLLAIGAVAVAPIALGAITVGFLSFSLWGVAVGALAFGSIALGWWSYGFAAVGGEAAAGGAAVARDYAIGVIVRAAEANTPAAKEWFVSQWFSAPVDWFLHSAHWLILLVIIVSLGRMMFRSWQLRRLAR